MGSTKQDVKSAGASSQPQCLLDQGHEPPRSIMEYATLHSQGRVYTCHGLTVRSAIILAFICGCSLGCR